MKIKGTAVWMVVASGCLLLAGCTETGSGRADLNAQIQELKAKLALRTEERDKLKADANNVNVALKKAEKVAADAKETNTKLQGQVQDLTKSRDEMSTKVEELSVARTDLQKRVDDLTTSRDQLQVMVNGLVDTRGTLERQVATLTKARDAARADAVSAQTKIDQLSETLKSQTQQMVDLQDQMVAVRAVLQQLQQKLQ